MIKKLTLLLVLILPVFVLAQKGEFNKAGKVEYSTWKNDVIEQEGGVLILEYANGVAKSCMDNSDKDLLPEVPKKYNYLNYQQHKIYRQAIFMDGDTCYTELDFRDLSDYKPEGEPEKILGYDCQKYVGSSFSNKIEIWVTKTAGIKGTPMLWFPSNDGLILKYVRNGNTGWEATKVTVKKSKKKLELMPSQLGEKVNDVEFNNRLANAFIKDIKVFSKQQINWGDDITNPTEDCLDSVYRFAGGTVVVKKVKLPQVPDGTSIYAEVTEQSNGDAYDRTGSVFVIPVTKEKSFLDGLKNGVDALPKYIRNDGKEYQGVITTNDFDPLIELMRFFTPFGVHHFNEKRDVGIDWADSVTYKEDVSHLLPVLRGECWVGVFVGNYDGGGHRVSLDLKYHLNNQEVDAKPQKKYWVQPVFNTTNVMEMAGQEYGTMFKNDTLTVDFEVPEGVKNIQFQYITTGHGGWGNGDEYLPKKNQLFLDSEPFFSFTPWRTDCGTYRRFNPASGNFWNGITSSDGSRSGWCPGTVSHPYFTFPEHLKPGKHRIQVTIPLGEREGNMFSAWNISGVFIGEIEE